MTCPTFRQIFIFSHMYTLILLIMSINVEAVMHNNLYYNDLLNYLLVYNESMKKSC